MQIAAMTALDDAFEAVTERVDSRSIAVIVPWRGRASRQAVALGSEWAGSKASARRSHDIVAEDEQSRT